MTPLLPTRPTGTAQMAPHKHDNREESKIFNRHFSTEER